MKRQHSVNTKPVISYDNKKKKVLLEEMDSEQKCLWELHILYPDKMKFQYKKALQQKQLEEK